MSLSRIHSREGCNQVAAVLQRVGDKWSVLVVNVIGERSIRFNELKRQVGGISQRMLTLTLRGLERDGLVTRTVTSTIPPRVDYALTPLGKSLLVPVRALGEWAITNQDVIQTAQRRFDEVERAETAEAAPKRRAAGTR